MCVFIKFSFKKSQKKLFLSKNLKIYKKMCVFKISIQDISKLILSFLEEYCWIIYYAYKVIIKNWNNLFGNISIVIFIILNIMFEKSYSIM